MWTRNVDDDFFFFALRMSEGEKEKREMNRGQKEMEKEEMGRTALADEERVPFDPCLNNTVPRSPAPPPPPPPPFTSLRALARLGGPSSDVRRRG